MSGWQQHYDPELHRQRIEAEDHGRVFTPPPWQQYPQAQGAPTQGWPQQPAAQPPRKRRRVFMWVFLAIQVLFIVWLIGGISNGHTAAANCHDQFLTHKECADATDAGTAIGVGLVMALWCVVDFLSFVTWLVVRLSRRR